MTTQPRLLDAPHDRALYLGPRQPQLMRVFWTHGAVTVSELLGQLAADPPLAYTTLMSMCVRLYEKGRRACSIDSGAFSNGYRRGQVKSLQKSFTPG
jgi:predicted transcriptional regulator